jgi:eukaryotic-like serine/threonine-protein kinase
MTPIQQRTNYPNLMSLQGTTLDGAYLLGQCLGADERTIIFKAQVQAGSPETAIVKIYRAEATAAEDQTAVWEEIKNLKHPNLAAIFGAGRTSVQAHKLIYVAVEPPDEILDKILRERALDADEAGELVVSVCRGLERLHAAGFVHGSVSPGEVLGIGDAIKLSTEGVRKPSSTTDLGLNDAKYRAPESPNGNTTPAADVWCLGATLFEAMTRREFAADSRAEAAKLPAPFGSIIHRCLYTDPEARCTLHEVVQLYEGRSRAFSAAAGADAGSIVRDLREAPGTSTIPRARNQSQVVQVLPNAGGDREIYHVNAAEPRRRIWAYLAIALLLVVGLIWLARPRKSGQRGTAPNSVVSTAGARRQPAAAPTANAAAPVIRQKSPQPAPAQITRTLTPAHPVTSAQVNENQRQPAAANQTHYVNGPVWRVVVYTYDNSVGAQKSASSINNKHPDLNAHVFSPNGNTGPYLVVVGGEMNRDDALALRQKARRLGMPPDTYVQNYKQ